jgi:signal transduction histidine kinase/DNA-binding response OmpR family regulator
MSRRDSMVPERPRVLIVDDRSDKLLALESILTTLDVDIVTASSGRDALRRLLHQDFALILLDVRMPGMDGLETATLIRQRERSANTPIIFITAFSEEMQMSRGYSLGAVDYILAPVVPEVLRAKVSVLAELFRASAEVRRQAESLRRRATQLHQLALVSLALNSSESVDAMIRIAAMCAHELLDGERTECVATIDDRQVRHIAGVDRGAGASSPIVAEVSRTKRIVRMAWEPEPGHVRQGVGVPLIGRDGKAFGVVEVGGAGEPFDQEDEDLLVQLAQMTAVAVENIVFREAGEANRLKDEFIAAVSHELRTPLNALRSWAWILRQHQLPPDRHARAVDGIDRSITAQARIIDDLLDVSRMMAGKMSLAAAPIDLGPVVQAAVDGLAAAAEAQGVRIERALGRAPVRVVGDADRLQQVVTNLLSNAIKFTPAGGTIEIDLVCVDGTAVLRVADTGCGIAPGFLPHVFERFRQADGSSTRRAGGLGVGLSIVRQLVEMHGGRVEAQSDGEGRGAVFTVVLPLLLEAAREERPIAAETGGGQPGLRGVRVLLVEDDADTREVMMVFLAEAGMAVTSASTADEGLLQLLAAPFDVLLCDIGLPGADGYSLIRRVRALAEPKSRIPALALTAFARDRDRERAREFGFDGHLAKPVDPPELLRTLAELLAVRGHERAGAADVAASSPTPTGAAARV